MGSICMRARTSILVRLSWIKEIFQPLRSWNLLLFLKKSLNWLIEKFCKLPFKTSVLTASDSPQKQAITSLISWSWYGESSFWDGQMKFDAFIKYFSKVNQGGAKWAFTSMLAYKFCHLNLRKPAWLLKITSPIKRLGNPSTHEGIQKSLPLHQSLENLIGHRC